MLSIKNEHDSLVLSLQEIGEPSELYRGDAQFYVGASSSGFRGDNTVWINGQELQSFSQDLLALKEARVGTAALSSISPGLFSVSIRSVDSFGTIVVEGSIAKDVICRTTRFRESVHFGFELDSAQFIHCLDRRSSLLVGHFASPGSNDIARSLLQPDTDATDGLPTWLHAVLKRPGMYFQTGTNEFLAFAAFTTGVTFSTWAGMSELQRREFAEINSSRFRSFVFQHFNVSPGFTLGWAHVIHDSLPDGAEALKRFKELWISYRKKYPAQNQ